MIDESQKPWKVKLTQEEYEIRVGGRCDVCRQLFKGKRKKCGCPRA